MRFSILLVGTSTILSHMCIVDTVSFNHFEWFLPPVESPYTNLLTHTLLLDHQSEYFFSVALFSALLCPVNSKAKLHYSPQTLICISKLRVHCTLLKVTYIYTAAYDLRVVNQQNQRALLFVSHLSKVFIHCCLISVYKTIFSYISSWVFFVVFFNLKGKSDTSYSIFNRAISVQY